MDRDLKTMVDASPPAGAPVDPEEILSAAVARDPYDYYARMRAASPLAWNEPTGSWYVTDYTSVARLLRHRALSARPGGVLAAEMEPADRAAVEEVETFFESWMVFSDPPRHTRMRDAVARYYTPQLIARWREALAEAADRLLEAVRPGEADIAGTFARQLAVHGTGLVLGVPPAEQVLVTGWADALMTYLCTPVADSERARAAQAAVGALRAYVKRAVAAPGAEPQVRALAALEPEEAVGFFAQVLTGGIDPVSACLGTLMAELLGRHATMLDAVADGSLDAGAVVEEALRYDPPFHFVPRRTTEALELTGQVIPSGKRVMLVLAAANRDPAVYPEPDAFRPGRTGAPHLAFGMGRHYCLGAGLARLVLREAVRALAAWPRRHVLSGVVSERSESFGSTVWRRVYILP